MKLEKPIAVTPVEVTHDVKNLNLFLRLTSCLDSLQSAFNKRRFGLIEEIFKEQISLEYDVSQQMQMHLQDEEGTQMKHLDINVLTEIYQMLVETA